MEQSTLNNQCLFMLIVVHLILLYFIASDMMKEENIPNETLFPDVTNTRSVVACDDPPQEEFVVCKSDNNDDTL
jgi:hypothetical protein